ncbi:hypothetical protein BB560_006792 [Smittium megazygosporum]|uniref:Delta(14)-sterol reductase n=1 Tax=Smittium megazygosporum TaxID=133381 RepID=A0A2T9Y1J7_9FUNG|nr:hypothetical protein BB560_006792 [Smittium megazygosporum]
MSSKNSNEKRGSQRKKPRYTNPKTTVYEFFGPLGVSLIMPGMVFMVLLSLIECNSSHCSPFIPNRNILTEWSNDISSLFTNTLFVDRAPIYAYIGWIAWLAALYVVLPGKMASGVQLRDGNKLQYPINGLSSAIVTFVALGGIVLLYGISPLVWVADNFSGIIVATMLVSTLQALILYLASFRGGIMLALGGNSGNPAYDFFMGRELNPRIGKLFDLKYFNELRPGIILWVVANICFVAKQYSDFGYVSNSMAIVVASQIFYAMDSLINESAVLTTMDITTEGFGWMLSFGDLSWLPSIYTLQARFLSFSPVNLSSSYCLFVSVVSVGGFLIFRLSNSQKNEFRSNPNSPKVSHLKHIQTKAGSRLLISGWWGMARHINYTGDWLLGLSQCLATSFITPYTYFFSAYFLALLLHRFARDEHKCKLKYGKDWDTYCSHVPYKFIPFIY